MARQAADFIVSQALDLIGDDLFLIVFHMDRVWTAVSRYDRLGYLSYLLARCPGVKELRPRMRLKPETSRNSLVVLDDTEAWIAMQFNRFGISGHNHNAFVAAL